MRCMPPAGFVLLLLLLSVLAVPLALAQWSYDGPTVGCLDVLDGVTGNTRSFNSSGSSIFTISNTPSFALRGPGCVIRGGLSLRFNIKAMRAMAVGAAYRNVSVSIGPGVHFVGLQDMSAAVSTWPLRLPTLTVLFAPTAAEAFDPDALPVDVAVGPGVTWTLGSLSFATTATENNQIWPLVTLQNGQHIPRGSRIAITDVNATISRCGIASTSAVVQLLVALLSVPPSDALTLIDRTHLTIQNATINLQHTVSTRLSYRLALLYAATNTALTVDDDARLEVRGSAVNVTDARMSTSSTLYTALVFWQSTSSLLLRDMAQLLITDCAVVASRVTGSSSSSSLYVSLLYSFTYSPLTLRDAARLVVAGSAVRAEWCSLKGINSFLYLSLLRQHHYSDLTLQGASRLRLLNNTVGLLSVSSTGSSSGVIVALILRHYSPLTIQDTAQMVVGGDDSSSSGSKGETTNIVTAEGCMISVSDVIVAATLHDHSAVTLQDDAQLILGYHTTVRATACDTAGGGHQIIALVALDDNSPLALRNASRLVVTDGSAVTAAHCSTSSLAPIHVAMIFIHKLSHISLQSVSNIAVNSSNVTATNSTGGSKATYVSLLDISNSEITLYLASQITLVDNTVAAVAPAAAAGSLIVSVLYRFESTLVLYGTARFSIVGDAARAEEGCTGGGEGGTNSSSSRLVVSVVYSYSNSPLTLFGNSAVFILRSDASTIAACAANTTASTGTLIAALLYCEIYSGMTLFSAARIDIASSTVTAANASANTMVIGGLILAAQPVEMWASARLRVEAVVVRAEGVTTSTATQLFVFGFLPGTSAILDAYHNAHVTVTRSTASLTRSTITYSHSPARPLASVYTAPTTILRTNATVRLCASTASVVNNVVNGTHYEGAFSQAGAIGTAFGTINDSMVACPACGLLTSASAAACDGSWRATHSPSNTPTTVATPTAAATRTMTHRHTATATAPPSYTNPRTISSSPYGSPTHTALTATAAVTITAAGKAPPAKKPPPPTPVVKTAQTVTGAVGSVGVVSTVAAVISTTGAIVRIAQCDDDDDDEGLSLLVHPLQFALGTGPSRFLRGAIVGNVLVIPAIAALVFGAVLPLGLLLVVRRRRQRRIALARAVARNSPAQAAAVGALGEAALSVRAVAAVVVLPRGLAAGAGGGAEGEWAREMLRGLRNEMGWPSVLALPQVALAEGTAVAATRLLVAAGAEGAAAAVPGVAGLLATALVVAWWVRALAAVVPSRDVRLEPASPVGVLIARLAAKLLPARRAAADPDDGPDAPAEAAWPWILLVPAFEFRVRAAAGGDGHDPGAAVLAVPLLGVGAASAGQPAPDSERQRRRRAEREARHDHIIGGKALRWAELGGYVCALGVGVAEGLPPASAALCRARVGAAFALIVVQGLLGVTTMMPLENVVIGALSIGSFVTATAALMNVVGAASTDRDLLQRAASVVGGLGLLALSVALVRPVTTARRMLRAADALIDAELAAAARSNARPDDRINSSDPDSHSHTDDADTAPDSPSDASSRRGSVSGDSGPEQDLPAATPSESGASDDDDDAASLPLLPTPLPMSPPSRRHRLPPLPPTAETPVQDMAWDSGATLKVLAALEAADAARGASDPAVGPLPDLQTLLDRHAGPAAETLVVEL